MEIFEKEEFRAVGIEVNAGFNELFTEAPKAWRQFIGRLDEVTGRIEDVMMDLSLKVENGIYTQLVGVEVTGKGAVPGGMMEVEIPRQAYIYHRHEGSPEGIARTFGEMYNWAEREGVRAGDFKIDYGYRADGSESWHDLYIEIIS